MIFTDRTITVRKGESRIDEPIVVYRGDYELEVRFTILNSRFKFMSGTNLIESEKASYGQLAILTPYGGNIFSDIVRCNDGSVTFVLTAEMLNQIEEVGLYSFQIRLMDYNKESRVSIPPIEYGIEVREPIASEDHDNSVNNAIVGYSIAKVVDLKEENVGDTFDENGNYIKTKWKTGDRISEGKLNKIEDAIDKINENEVNNTAVLSRRIDNNFNILDSIKADKNEIFSMKNMGQDIKEAMTGGSVAVVGENAILSENIVDGQVSVEKTDFVTITDTSNLIEVGKIEINKWINTSTGDIESNNYTSDYCVTSLIKVKSSETYSIRNGYTAYSYITYTADMNVSRFGYALLSYTIQDNEKYIRLCFKGYNDQLNELVLVMSDGPINDYIKTKYEFVSSPYLTKEDLNRTTLISFDETDFVTTTDTSNLIEVGKIEINKWINTSTGDIESNNYTSDYCITDIMELKLDTAYSMRKGYPAFSYVVYDEDKNKLRYGRGISYIYTLAGDEKYIRLCFKDYNDQLDELALVMSDVPVEGKQYKKYAFISSDYVTKNDIENIGIEDNRVKLSLPPQYELVVGDTFELFYKGIILANNPYNYNIKIECSKGNQYSKRYLFTPTQDDIGTISMRISLINDNEAVLDSKEVSLIVKPKATNPTTPKTLLIVGDSLTSGGQRATELIRRLRATDGNPMGDGLTNIKAIGTCGENDYKFEGYGGWRFHEYLTQGRGTSIVWINVVSGMKTNMEQHSIYKDSENVEWKLETIDTDSNKIKIIRTTGTNNLPQSGTLTWVSGGEDHTNITYTLDRIESQNPFWFNNAVDFQLYAVSQGVSSIDYINVLLGWNDTNTDETTYKNLIRKFIDKVLTPFPNCKITLCGLQVPSLDGMGANYGCSWNYYEKLKFVFDMNKWLEDISNEYSNVYFLQISGQFDSENNMPIYERNVNVRNDTKEKYGGNGVHPANSGYYQIADAEYRHLTHLLQN